MMLWTAFVMLNSVGCSTILPDCILESELGVVDAGLETQLRALENALAGKIKES